MSFFSSMTKGFSTLGKAALTATRSPILGGAIRAVPFLGTAAAVTDVGMSLYNMASAGNKSGGSPMVVPNPFSPPIPKGFAPPIPFGGAVGTAAFGSRAAPAGSTVPAIQQQHALQIASHSRGKRPPIEGWNNLVNSGVTLGQAYFRYKVSGPSGYVAVRNPLDHSQVVLAPKEDARRAGLWKPHAKPPISVRHWHAIRDAKTAIKKLKMVQKAAGIVTHATTRTAASSHKGHRPGCGCFACKKRG